MSEPMDQIRSIEGAGGKKLTLLLLVDASLALAGCGLFLRHGGRCVV